MSDLRTLWPSLSIDQRNALVAMGMGWRLYADTRSGYRFLFPYPPRKLGEREQAKQPASWGEMAKTELWRDMLPDFCGSWPGCGMIWEECERRELDISISRYPRSTDESPVPSVVSIVRGADLWEGGCTDARESLALAFCLASQVEVPAEWLSEGGADA